MAAAAAMAGGLSVIVYGIIRNDPARSLGGACLAITALTLISLTVLRRWIVDTSDERRILDAARRHAEAERSRYFAAQAALENEQGRLNRDMAAERLSLAVRLQVERETMAADFEEKRATLISETMEATVRMVHGGKLAPKRLPSCNLIQFPEQQSRERERSRGHNEVAP